MRLNRVVSSQSLASVFIMMALLSSFLLSASLVSALSCKYDSDCPSLLCMYNKCCEPWKTSCDGNYIFQHYTNCNGRDTTYCPNGCQWVNEYTAQCKATTSSCSFEDCNIGHYLCNLEPPSKTYTVPSGKTCTYTGIIRQSESINQFPPTFTIRGNGCNKDIQFPGCDPVSYSVTCNPGTVTFAANDSAYFTVTESCTGGTNSCPFGDCNMWQNGGNGQGCQDKSYTVPAGQSCTFTGTIRQSSSINKFPPIFKVRGNGCSVDVPFPGCDVFNWQATCGAGTVTFSSDDSAYYTRTESCTSNPYCGDGKIDPGEECEYNSQCSDGNPNTQDTCVNCQCQHTSIPYCGDGNVDPGEECEADIHCNDNNPSTLDYCAGCVCYHEDTSFCGDGNIDPGEECELPTTNNNPNCVQTPTTECQGPRRGVRDAYGYCGLSCSCIDDAFAYACVAGSCGAECDSNSDCNDDDPGTMDACNNQCACEHIDIPYCGDGDIDPGEQCEDSEDCGPGQVCSDCWCHTGPYCGDGNRDEGEECDYGVAVNGIPCVPPLNGSCTYCTDECEWRNLTGGGCGNGIVEYGEQCDAGDLNGNICEPLCDDFCAYCDSTCQVNYVDGPPCYTPCDNCTPTPEPPSYPCYTGNCPIPYYIGYTPRVRASICGDGIIGIGEECDDGYDNGIACSPACNGACTYCDANCHKVVLDGSPCVRTARPWDVGSTNPCRKVAYPIYQAKLDIVCDSFGRDVTREVNLSDNLYAVQEACNMDASNIYLDFMGIVPGAISNISLVLEHREKNAHLRVEYLKGDSWLHQCSLAAAAKDTRDECVIKLEDIEDFYKIPLKVRVLRSGNDASESLDQAYLEVEYCPTSMNCGDGVIGTGEECDDGNLLNGDGCSEFCTREILMCGNWGACVEGKQTQTCFYGDSVRVNVRGCGNVFFFENFLIILLIVLLALLILFFLFFPAFYMAARKRKEEERRKRE